MKKKLIAALPLLIAASDATAQVLYEPFDYTGTTTNLSFPSAPSRFSLQGTYWATRGTASTTNLRVSTENIPTPSYLGGANILPPSIGQTARSVTTGNAEYATLGLGEYYNQVGQNLYWSSVIRPNSIPSSTAGVMFAGILSFTLPTTGTPSTRQLTMWTRTVTAGTYQIGLGTNSSASADVIGWSGDITGTTNSHFVVAKLTINATSGNPNDTVSMWVDPTSNFGSTTEAPSGNAFAFMTGTSLSDLTDSIPTTAAGGPAQTGFFIRSGAAGTGNMHFDDVRVDSTWAGVTPNGNNQYTYTGAAAGGTIAGSTWSNPLGAASPNGLGHVANLGNMGVAGTTLNAGATITSAGETVDTINIRNANPIIIGGTGLTISSNASAGQIVAWSGGAHQVTAPLTLASNLAVKADSDASITMSGAITGAGKTVQKFGQGNVVLSGANLFASNVSLDVRAGNIDFGGVAQQFDTLTLGIGHENISTGLGGPDMSPVTVSGTSTVTANNFVLQSYGTTGGGTVAFPLSGGNVIKNRATTITLGASNNYTGSTIVNGGQLNITNNDNLGATPTALDADNITIAGAATLRILEDYTIPTNRGITMNGSSYSATNAGIISIASGKTVSYAGTITGPGGFTLTGNNASTMILSGNSNYAGPTNVVGIGATVTMRLATDNALPITTVLGMNGTGATLDLGDASNAGFNQTLGGIITNGVTPLITNTGTTIKTLTVDGSGASDVNFPIAGNLNVVKSGTGVLTLRGADTYAGTTTVNSGGAIVVGTAAGTAIPGYTANLTVNSGGGFGARLGADSAASTADLDAIQTDAAVFNGANKHVAIEVTAAAGGTQTYSTPIADVTGSRGLMKYGGGTLELSGTNTYSGNTMLKGGVLQVSSTDNLGNGSASNDISVDATSTLRTTAGITTNRDVVLNTGTVLSVDASSGDSTLTGVVSGAGALTKTGPGMLVLSSSNSYTGNTIINGTASGAGILRVTNNNALGTTAGTTFITGGSGNGVNAQLDIDGTGGNLTIAEPIIIEGKTASTLTPHIRNVAGNNTISAPLSMDAAGTWYNLQSDAGKLTIAGINNATGNATSRQLKLRGAGNGEITGPIQNTTGTGTMPLEKLDSGTWTLSGNNTYTGNTTVTGGKLVFNSSYGTGSALSVADGARGEMTPGNNKSLRFTSLGFNTTGVLDISNNKLIVQFGTNASPLAATRTAIINGRGGTDFGTATWQGTGGIASDAAAPGGIGDGTNGGDGISFAVGYVENSFLPNLGLPSYTSFGGQTVDSGSMLIRFTKGADANLDGKVNSDDVTIVGALFGNAGSGEWFLGDFDYDGICDSDDVTVLGALYDATAPALSSGQLTAAYGSEFAAAFARGQAMGAAVPEPTSLSLLGLGGIGLLKRRRRNA